jgi:alcohol dehydrogenase class IV
MEFYNPVTLLQGSGVRSKLVDECIGKRVLVFCTESAYERHKRDSELSRLFSLPTVMFEHAFDTNPSLSDILEISLKYTNSRIDVIIGLGGGSAMDVGKIASVSIPAHKKGIELSDLLVDCDLFSQFKAIDCLQVPTTAGTGSEVTPFATVWDYKTQIKKSLSNPVMFAKKAYIDPDFLVGIPLEIAISTGLDALNQAFESIWNKNATATSLLYALRAAQLCLEALPKLREMDSCSNTRASLSEASLYAGIAISQTRTSICHSISYPLTLKFSLPHGLACAFSMKEVYEFNKGSISKFLIILERSLGRNPYDLICDIYKSLQVENMISSYVAEPNHIMAMLGEMKTTGRFDNNIKECQLDDLDLIISNSVERLLTSRKEQNDAQIQQ